LSPPPHHANSFVLGTAVINTTHTTTLNDQLNPKQDSNKEAAKDEALVSIAAAKSAVCVERPERVCPLRFRVQGLGFRF
jgi:hypothetical protein